MATYSTKMRVFQNWGTPQAGDPGEQNVFVFGPKYSLSRYTDPVEKEQMVPYSFESTGESVTIKDVVPVSANYKLTSFEMYAENAYYKKADLNSDDVTVDGQYLDGVLLVRGDVDVEKGDYIAVKSEQSLDFIRVNAVEKVADAEYSEVSWTKIALVEGLPDAFADGGVPVGTTVFVAHKLDSVKVNDAAVSVSAADVTFNPTGAITVNGADVDIIKADLFFSTKRLYTGTASGIQMAASSADVEEVLGPADPENPVSMGVMNAFLGGARVVYYYVTEGDSVDAFSKALERATLNSTLYYLVPMTQDEKVLALVVSHVKTMSTEEVKRWRVAVVCTPVNRTVVTDELVVKSNGIYINQNTAYKTLVFADKAPDVVDGDVITVGETEFTCVKKLNSTTVLTDSTDTDSASIGDAKLTHVLTDSEYAKAVAGSAKGLGTFRAIDVFPKTYGFAGDRYSGLYLAPIVAGMAVSELPHAPLTNKVVPGVDDIPEIYNGFSSAQLDTMAAGGTFIVTQDQMGEACYVRKQLTTGTSSNVLAKTEFSMVRNFDWISYYFNSVVESFKGSYNVTPSLVQLIYNRLWTAVHHLANLKYDDMIGPMILGDSRVEDVYVDPTNATRIIAHVVVVLPAPFNEMDLYLSVEVMAEYEVNAQTQESTSNS